VTSRSDLVRIPSIGCELKLEDIYFKIPGPGESAGDAGSPPTVLPPR
jgi:hypothetical protein